MMALILFILLFSFFHVTMIDYLYNNPTYYQLDAYTCESDDFRSMKLGRLIADGGSIDYSQLTSLMIENDYNLEGVKNSSGHEDRLVKAKPLEYNKLKKAYETVLSDLRYFPIPENTRKDSPPVAFENSWMEKRTYGGERGHEGCDIMGNQRPRGYYPVVSICDGVVEKMGWLEKGGYRIGIRSPHGAYLYYAHLYSFAPDLEEGVSVKAGELLGFMGDTGYSKAEGTTGNFEVHLHLGIYIKTDHMDEMSVNPYWILKYLEKFRLKYSY